MTTDHTRRNFLTIAGLSTAGAAVAAVPGAAGATEDDSLPDGAAGAMAVFVDDVRSGQLTLMIEGDEVAVTDKKLTARIVRAYQRAAH